MQFLYEYMYMWNECTSIFWIGVNLKILELFIRGRKSYVVLFILDVNLLCTDIWGHFFFLKIKRGLAFLQIFSNYLCLYLDVDKFLWKHFFASPKLIFEVF